MPIILYTGRPGSGKSAKLADTTLNLLLRNEKIFKKTGLRRLVCSNLKLTDKYTERFKDFLFYWSDPSQLIKFKDCDVIWDEIATHLDSTNWKEVPLSLKRWLQQHRKLGVEIFGTTQDFAMVDISMRRMTSELKMLRKIIGSRDKSSTKPDVKYIWGLVIVRNLNPEQYSEDKKLNQAFGWGFMLITRELVEIFDTTQEIEQGIYPPLKHIERHCDHVGCKNPNKIIHA